MLSLSTYLYAWVVAGTATLRARGDAGQATAEYALVLVGAASVALLLIGWAAKTDRIGKLFEAVVDSVSGHVS